MISIITPVLNGEDFIEDNLKSISQLKIPYEHIIVDGGSTDRTLEIISKHPGVKLIHQTERTGMYGAIHLGIQNSAGNYIGWVNCDDQVIPSGYEKMVKHAELNNVDFMYSDAIFNFVNEQKHVIMRSTPFGKYFLLNGIFPFCQSSSIFTRKLYDQVNGFNYQHFKISGDFDLYFRMAQVTGIAFKYLRVKSSIFLKYGNSLGDKNSELSEHERTTIKYIPDIRFIDRALYKIVRTLRL